ncbi:MAG: hypothetical protein A2W11_13970 [Ignavibacteria bacterium RBG_16_35_7]|nr:MAG: hypothetical protein A2W11_13970 [Ignavibacteria bacterium RBG_16_35_7]
MIFWDLDGPILDVSEKYYRVYYDILSEHNCSQLDKDEYWQLKRQRIPTNEILNYTKCKITLNKFHELWLNKIETPGYVKYDILQKGAFELLKKLHLRESMVLVTLRKSREILEKQLMDLNLSIFFKDVLSSGDERRPKWKVKYNLINEYLNGEIGDKNIIIGDTETDIITGNELGLKTIAVLNGIRTTELLTILNPDFICNSVEDLLNLKSIDII